MKILYSFLAFFLSLNLVMGQAKPSYTQYILNNYILNPAISGVENYTDSRMSYRNQWTGIKGSPVTGYFTIHAPLGKEMRESSSPTSFTPKGTNPRGKAYWESYTAPPAHHGMGMQIVSDRAGYLNRWSAMGTYAYHMPLSSKTTLAGGFSAGLSSVSLDRSKVYFATLDPNDPALGYANSELSKIKPELGAGLFLYAPDYFIGASVLNVIPGKNRFVKNNAYGSSFTPNFFLSGGYRFALDDNFTLLPSVMMQHWKPQLYGAHLNVKLQYQEIIWGGANFRYSDLISGYSAFLGLHIANTVNVSYAYEMATTSRLKNYTGNTHEVMIGFIFGNKYGDSCPRNVW